MKKITLALLTLLISTTPAAAHENSSFDSVAKKLAKETNNLKPAVAKLALKAFYNADQLGVHAKKKIVTIIDYSLPSTQKRLWVVDVESEKILYTSLVAHGKYSGENYTTTFSNQPGSLQTSLGVFMTENPYFGRDGYSLRINGLEKGFNDHAKARTIVMHGAPYVSQELATSLGRVGRSWGCPAVEKKLAVPIINTIKDGSLIVAYYPDKNWLNNSKFIV